ncbi:Ppx/GppA phosphatase family protein [Streptomyces sp. NPDC002574]|uniref:Ppx/GppA phosphatase family protein n=1 Tax=Streptomyces sp. NPDC002574 TaxID=3364652 RepID=UPI0036BB62BE
MRIGLLDIGSHTAHLRIADLTPGLPPWPVTSHKRAIRLAAGTDRSGTIDDAAVRRLVAAVGEAVAVAESYQVDVLLPFATSSVRDAANREAVLAEVRAATGVEVSHMDGEEEARLTFLAARGWYGWSAGTMLLLDIGGGSLEIAHGAGREPAFAVSLPLGAGRLTRDHLPAAGPSRGRDVKALRRHVRSVLARPAAVVGGLPRPALGVAASKTFTQLACLTGAPRPKAGPHVPRTLDRAALGGWIPRLAALPVADRARLPGVSATRARQILAGAVVAEALMDLLRIERLQVCPWALREGILLHRLRELEGVSAGRVVPLRPFARAAGGSGGVAGARVSR